MFEEFIQFRYFNLFEFIVRKKDKTKNYVISKKVRKNNGLRTYKKYLKNCLKKC